MAWLPYIVLLPAVVGLWILIAARYTASKQGDELVTAYSRILPAFVVAICLAGFFLAPGRSSLMTNVALWVHHAAAWSLFAFLLSGEYLLMEAWWRMRRGEGRESIGAVYHHVWILTKFVPPPAALAVFLTGLRLIWEAPETNSPSNLWLFGMVLGFSFFFFDGIFGYTCIITELDSHWRSAADPEMPLIIASRYRRLGARAQILLHTVSWPLVFLLGVFRWNPPNPLSKYVAASEQAVDWLPRGWPQIAVAFLLWALMGIIVAGIRVLPRRDMSTARTRTKPTADPG